MYPDFYHELSIFMRIVMRTIKLTVLKFSELFTILNKYNLLLLVYKI